MERNTFYKKIISLILATIMLVQPFASTIAMATSIIPETKAQESQTIITTPGEEAQAPTTPSLELPKTEENTKASSPEEAKTEENTKAPSLEIPETSIITKEEENILVVPEDKTKLNLPTKEELEKQEEEQKQETEANESITPSLPQGTLKETNLKNLGQIVEWHLGNIPKLEYKTGETIDLTRLTLVVTDAHQNVAIMTYRNLLADKSIQIHYTSPVITGPTQITITKAGLEDLTINLGLENSQETASAEANQEAFSLDNSLIVENFKLKDQYDFSTAEATLETLNKVDFEETLKTKITSTASYLNQEIVAGFKSEYKMTYEIVVNKSLIKENDYYTIRLSDHFRPRAQVSDLKSKDGQILAKAFYDFASNTIVYQFTKLIEQITETEKITVEENLQLDQSLASYTGDLDIFTLVAGTQQVVILNLVGQDLEDNRLVVKKVDPKGQALEGAKFALYNSADQKIKEDTTNVQGRIDFGKLEKGLYKIVEEEAPQGFEKTKDTYIVTVKEDGTTSWSRFGLTAQRANINSKLQVEEYTLEQNGEEISLLAKIKTGEEIKEGDYFTIKLDPNLQGPKKVPNLENQIGLILAEGTYDSSLGEIKYTFSKIAEGNLETTLAVNIEGLKLLKDYLNKENIQRESLIVNTIGEKHLEEKVFLETEANIIEGTAKNYLNISSKITDIDWVNKKVQYEIQLNPNKTNIDEETLLTISQEKSRTILDLYTTRVEVYGQNVGDGFSDIPNDVPNDKVEDGVPDISQLTNVSKNFDLKNYTEDELGAQNLQIKLHPQTLNGKNLKFVVTTDFQEEDMGLETKVGLSAKISTLREETENDYAKTSDSKTKAVELKKTIEEVILPVVNYPEEGQVEKLGNSTIIVENLDENNLPIVGSKYQISDFKTGEALWIKTSDINGKAAFIDLAPGEYLLEEIFTPEGYVSAGYKIQILVDENKNTSYKALKIERSELVELEPELYKIELKKEKEEIKEQAKLNKLKEKENPELEDLEIKELEKILGEIMSPKISLEDLQARNENFKNFKINEAENSTILEEKKAEEIQSIILEEKTEENAQPIILEEGKIGKTLNGLTKAVERLLGKPKIVKAAEANTELTAEAIVDDELMSTAENSESLAVPMFSANLMSSPIATKNTNIWDSAVPIIIGTGQIEARGELEGDTITWTIKARGVSKNAKIEITLSNGQNVKEAKTISGPDLKSNSLNKSKYNFTLTSNNPSGEYRIVTEINPGSQEHTMTLSYNNSSFGNTQSRTISLKTQAGQEGNYRGLISNDGYLSVEDKDGNAEKALCINTDKTFPKFGTKYPFEQTSIDKISSLITNKNYTNNEELITKIKQAIYYADTKKESLLEGVNLTGGNAEQTFYHMIQGVIWRYTDGDDTYDEIKKHITNTQDQEKLIEAMDEIYEKSQKVQPEDYNKVEIRVFKPVNNENFQNLISYKIENKIIPYSVGPQFKLLKLEKGTSNRLPGAKFSLKNDSFSQVKKGNYNGEITFSNIPQGEYTLKEEEAPSGYQKTDKTAKVTVDSQGEVNIEGELVKKETSGTYGVDVFVVENPKNPDGPLGKFILKKTDKNGRPLKGAKFSLERNGTSKTIELKDNEEGLTIDNLSPGSYTLKETKAPDGYTKTEETATITVDNAGNTSVQSNTSPSQDILVTTETKTVLSYDNKELNIVIAVENRYPKGTTERYSHYRTTAASIYDAFKNTPGLKGKVHVILGGTIPANTNVVTFDIGASFQFPANNNVQGWMDQAFTKATTFFQNSTTTENILITLFEGKYEGGKAKSALENLLKSPINKVFNYVYSQYYDNTQYSLTQWYKSLKNTNYNVGFENMIQDSMFANDRDFYVKEYITGIAKDGSIKNVADRGSHIKEHQVTVPTVTISNGIFAKLIIKKTDKADNKALQGAEFTLTKKDSSESFTATSTENGLATFDKIPPGEYILKETKAPDKYKKIETEWNVYVSPKGSIFVNEKKDNLTPQEVKGEDISNKLTGTITLSTPENTLTVGDNLNKITINGNFDAKDVKAGDYFDLKISETIHYNMLQPDKPNQPIIKDTQNGIIAVPTLLESSLGGEKIIRYTFVKDLQSVKFSFKLDYSVDVYGAKNNGSYDFKASVGNIIGTINRQVSYSGGKSITDGLNIDASFDYTNDQNGKYSQVIYVNQKGSNITDPTHLEITPYVDNSHQLGYITANISPIATAIKVYKLKPGQSLSNAVIYEKDKLEDVTGSFKNKIKIDYGKATVQFDNIGTDKYVVVADSNMIYPQGQIQGTYLVQVAKLINNITSASIWMNSGIATTDSSSLGTGSTYTSNKIELEIENEKEVKGKFTINKTDEQGKSLKEAEFKLSKKTNYGSSLLDKKYQVEGNFEPLIKNTENGNVTFDNLPPGTYDLEETKSPDGYIKDMRKFVVVVQKDGKTYVVDATSYKPESYPLEGDIQKPNIDIDESKARTSPMNLDGRIEVTGYKLFTKERNSYGNMVESQSSNVNASVQALWMKANLEFPEDTIVGDTFTIVLDENLDMRGVSLEDKTQKPFVDEKGNELAKHINTSQVDGKYVFTYKITKKPENADQLILSLERPVYVNRNKIWQSDYTYKTFTNTIAGTKQSPSQEFSIIYNSFKASGLYPNNGYEIGNEPFIYPSSNKVDVYIQATSYGNDTLKLLDSNLDFSNAEVTISRDNDYGYIGESKKRPASFGTEIMDFSHVVESEKITKNNSYVEIKLPGENYNWQKYNIKVIGARKIDTNQGINSTSAIYSNSSYYYNNPVVSYTKSLAPIQGESKGKYIKTPKITVKKTDETGNIFLPGAEFKLENNQGYSQTRTTNSRGELVFTGIKQSGYYTLTETKAPEGYEKLLGSGLTVNVDLKYGSEPDGSLDDVSIRSIDELQNASVSGNTITVKNNKGPYTPPEVKFANYPNHIQFTKVDEKNQPLKGAKFKLILDKDDKAVANSEREGSLISYEKLAPGKYQVRETDQPKGYLTPKEKNNTVATFTVKDDGTITDVKTYSLEGKLVESNGDHKIYNIPEDGKGKFTIYKKAYKKASGEDEGAKIALKGATFTLSKMQKEKGNREDLPKTFNDLVKTVEREDGSLKFDSLDPGVYELKETKSPDGYVKSDEVYVVVVAKSGKTTIVPESAFTPESFPVDDIITDPNKETTPNTRKTVKNLDEDIQISGYKLYQKENNPTVYHHKAQSITMEYTITLPKDIIPGDTFTVDLDDKFDLNGIEITEEMFDDFKNEYGEVIAKSHKNSSSKNSYTFTLTEYVRGKTNISVRGQDNIFVDPNIIKETGYYNFTNQIGNKTNTTQLYISFEPHFYKKEDRYNDVYTYREGWKNQYYRDYISGKHYIDRSKKQTEIYYYVYGYNNMENIYEFLLSNYTNKGENGSVYFNRNQTKVDVYKVDKPFNYYTNGQFEINKEKIIPSMGDKIITEKNPQKLDISYNFEEQKSYGSQNYNSIRFKLGRQSGDYGYLIKVTTPYEGDNPRGLIVNGLVVQGHEVRYNDKFNNVYVEKRFSNISLNMWIEEYGSSRQGDADKLLNIKLTKEELLNGKASGKFIPGAGFRLQSRDGYTAYKKTDDQGVLNFENVPEGTYALTETFTPQGYNHPVSAWIVYVRYDYKKNKSKIVIKDVNNLIERISDNELKVYNSKEEIKYPIMEYLNIPNRIEFTKVDYKDSLLNNVQFALKAKGSGKEGITIQTAKSGEDGKFAFEKIAPEDYEVWEQQAPEGYKTPDKAVATFTVDKDGKIINLQIDGKAVQEGSGNKIVNKKLGKIEFMKVKANEGVSVDDSFIPNDKNSSQLQGAEFELQKLSQSDDGTSQYTKIKEVKDYTDGKISFSDLEEGSYKLIETKAPDGYKKPSYDAAKFDINSAGEVSNLTVNGKAVKLENDKEIGTENSEGNSSTIENKSDKIEMKAPYRILNTKEAKLKIVKKDAENNTLLGGAIFELYRIKNGQDSKLDPNSDGFDMSKLEKYSKETKDGKDIITWIDSKTSNDNTKIETSSEDNNKGAATITGLSDGIYWLKESKAPKAYVPYGKFIGRIEIKNGKVTVPEDQKEPLTLKIENENSENPVNVATVTNRKPVYPSTGGMGTLAFTLVGGALMTGATIAGRKKKREDL